MIKNKTKKLVVASLCVALGVVLPYVFHSVPNGGKVFLPMHLPVLLCGLVCGWQLGLLCGVVTPMVSSIVTGMPPAPYVFSMVVELAVYGLVAGLLIKHVKTKSFNGNLYVSLIGAMLVGRIFYGLTKALFFNVGEYSLKIWLTSSFVTALPGIIIQLIFLPLIINILHKSNVVE